MINTQFYLEWWKEKLANWKSRKESFRNHGNVDLVQNIKKHKKQLCFLLILVYSYKYGPDLYKAL